jgi:NTE family protein
MNQDLINKKVALVLSSGGARGVAHIGVIEALEELGYDIHAIAGCSIGAVVGGIYAAGKLPEFKEWLCNLDKVDLFKLFDFTLSSQGFVKGEKVFKELRNFIDDYEIEDLRIPFVCVAVDILTDEEVVFEKGSLFDAMRASAAIPSIVTPVRFGNRIMVDGGVLNPIPLNLIKRMNDDVLVCVDVNGKVKAQKNVSKRKPKEEKEYQNKVEEFAQKLWALWPKSQEEEEKKFGILELVTKSLDLMQDKLSDIILEKHQPDILVTVPRNTAGTFEFYKSADLIDFGKKLFLKNHEEWMRSKKEV